MKERLQKILAKAGVGSRRVCETYIEDGRVTVNGKVATIGMKADPAADFISFDGKKIKSAEPLVYVILYKPRNVISTVSSPDPRRTVRDLIPLEGRLYPVGRLDIESEGLVLMTNDGDLANKLTHPRYGCEKEYSVQVPRVPDIRQLKAWRNGVVLDDGYRTSPADVRIDSETPRGAWLRIIMKEGRKRQIREIGDQLGLPVGRLIRTRIGSLKVGSMKPRQWRELTEREVKSLKDTGKVSKGRNRSKKR